MPDSTIMPSNLIYFQWSRAGAENPRLANPISALDTTIVASNAALDEDGAAITGNFMMGIKDINGYTESIFVPAGASSDGITFVGCIRGVDLAGIDFDTQNSAGNAVAHKNDDPVFSQITGVNFQLMISALQGAIASGANAWRVGDETASDVLFFAQTNDANKPFFKLIKGSPNKWVLSVDGVTEIDMATGGVSVAGDGIDITASVIKVDLATVSGLEFSAGKLLMDTSVIQDCAWTYQGTDTGSADAYAIDLTPALTAYTEGLELEFKVANTNTGASTIDVNSLGTKNIKLTNGNDPSAGDLQGIIKLKYDGTNFQVFSPTGAGGVSQIDGPLNAFNSNRISVDDTFSNLVVIGSASATTLGMSVRLITSVSGDYSRTDARPFVFLDFAGLNPSWFANIQLIAITDQDCFFGIDGGQVPSALNGTFTADHAGFIVQDAQIFASVADGATQSKSSDLSITLTDENQYFIEKVGSNYLFYINGSLVHTSSGNEPNSTLQASEIWVRGSASGSKEIRASSHKLSYDK